MVVCYTEHEGEKEKNRKEPCAADFPGKGIATLFSSLNKCPDDQASRALATTLSGNSYAFNIAALKARIKETDNRGNQKGSFP